MTIARRRWFSKTAIRAGGSHLALAEVAKLMGCRIADVRAQTRTLRLEYARLEDDGEPLGVAEVAFLLGADRATVREFIKIGRLAAETVERPDGTFMLLVRLGDVRALAEQLDSEQ